MNGTRIKVTLAAGILLFCDSDFRTFYTLFRIALRFFYFFQMRLRRLQLNERTV